jgi:hypothetical protein
MARVKDTVDGAAGKSRSPTHLRSVRQPVAPRATGAAGVQGTRVNAKYTCTYHPYYQYGYRSSLYLEAEKGGTIGTVGHDYSNDNALFFCI